MGWISTLTCCTRQDTTKYPYPCDCPSAIFVATVTEPVNGCNDFLHRIRMAGFAPPCHQGAFGPPTIYRTISYAFSGSGSKEPLDTEDTCGGDPHPCQGLSRMELRGSGTYSITWAETTTSCEEVESAYTLLFERRGRSFSACYGGDWLPETCPDFGPWTQEYNKPRNAECDPEAPTLSTTADISYSKTSDEAWFGSPGTITVSSPVTEAEVEALQLVTKVQDSYSQSISSSYQLRGYNTYVYWKTKYAIVAINVVPGKQYKYALSVLFSQSGNWPDTTLPAPTTPLPDITGTFTATGARHIIGGSVPDYNAWADAGYPPEDIVTSTDMPFVRGYSYKYSIKYIEAA